MSELLNIEHLSVSFAAEEGKMEAVRDVSFSLKSGEVLAIVGESGCGKSVLCKSIMKLLPKNGWIEKGSIAVNGEDIANGNADEEGLQKQPEQGADIHLHQAGLQHGQANVVDTGISGNDAAGIGYHLLGDIEHRHHDVKSIADEPHRNSSLKNPAHDEGRLKLCHIVVLGNHLDQFVTGDKGQDDACNGQHHVPGQRFDHGEHPWLKAGGLGAHLLCDVAHLGVHIIKQAGEIGHNACRQDAFDPVGNGFENGFHSVTVLS